MENAEKAGMTANEFRRLSPEERYDLASRAIPWTADKAKELGIGFSASFLSDVMREDGYRNKSGKWIKVEQDASESESDVLVMEAPDKEDVIRVPVYMSRAVAEKWKRFTEPYRYKSIIGDAALMRFMDDVMDGKVRVVLPLPKMEVDNE